MQQGHMFLHVVKWVSAVDRWLSKEEEQHILLFTGFDDGQKIHGQVKAELLGGSRAPVARMARGLGCTGDQKGEEDGCRVASRKH